MYGILRVEKIKLSDGGGLRGRALHNFREFESSKNTFEPELTAKNEYVGAQSYEELRAAAAARWETLTDKPRSDAVGMLEVMVTTTAGALPERREQDFFESVRKEVASWYGEENVLAMAVHRDETTPHCHIFLTPIETKVVQKAHLSAKEKDIVQRKNSGQQLSEDEQSVYKSVFKKKTSLNARKLMNGKKGLSALQTEFHQHVFSHFGLERGEIGGDEPKKNVRSSLRIKARQLDEREAAVLADEEHNVSVSEQLISVSDEIDERASALKRSESAVEARERALLEREKKIHQNEKMLSEARERLSEREKQVSARENTLNAYEQAAANELALPKPSRMQTAAAYYREVLSFFAGVVRRFDDRIRKKNTVIKNQDAEIKQKDSEIKNQDAEIEERDRKIADMQQNYEKRIAAYQALTPEKLVSTAKSMAAAQISTLGEFEMAQKSQKRQANRQWNDWGR